jgi:hypothetical protein
MIHTTKNIKYYDFVVKTNIKDAKEKPRTQKNKLPADSLRSALILKLHLSSLILNTKFDITKIDALHCPFFQVIEYNLVTVRGNTIHQYKEIQTYSLPEIIKILSKFKS